MFMKKMSMLFFLLGSLIAILSAAFEIMPGMEYPLLFLIFLCGSFIGLFNVSQEEETKFLLSTFILVFFLIYLQMFIASTIFFIEYIDSLIVNFIWFMSASMIVVAIKIFIRTASEGDYSIDKEFIDEFDETKIKSYSLIWNIIVFISVAIVFILFVLELVFDISAYNSYLFVLEWIIWIIFAIDLYILYKNSKSFMDFLKHGWLDIIATIPPLYQIKYIYQFSRVAKVSRMIKIGSIFSKLGKVSKTTKLMRSMKFSKYFSKKSGFNTFLLEEEKKKQKIPNPKKFIVKKNGSKSGPKKKTYKKSVTQKVKGSRSNK